ncbi:DUF3303 domain-containing protein [Methylocystis sp.]|jgi:hypothetical protein|uniref:DUF3303 domain-containing protein n=1 Tax=Methylocystis sp. TaxID=1911079 RepID=UPI003D11C0AF
MLFAVHYEITPEHRDEALKRFQKFGDDAPKGTKVVANWFSVTLLEGWTIIQGDDVADLCKLFLPWTNLNVNHITPVIEGAAVHKFIEANKK